MKFETLKPLLNHPTVFLPKKRIFLLSHMRAYTSLIGHIMGSSPEICGYYELHIGYYSWRSLIRQKLIFFQHENPKPGFSYMFDKVLHNEHRVSVAILDAQSSKVIFSLRSPRQTIPSIIKLYREIDPSHELTTMEAAVDYYIGRVQGLAKIATEMTQPFFYFDAEVMKVDAEGCLSDLTRWLSLESPLSPDYDLQLRSSSRRYGDTSEHIRAGTIIRKESSYDEFQENEAGIALAENAYRETREVLSRLSIEKRLADDILFQGS